MHSAMILTFLTPILKVLLADGKEKIGLAMATPVTANVNDMRAPIGTLPNVLAYTMHGHDSAKGYGKPQHNHGINRTNAEIYFCQSKPPITIKDLYA